MNSLELIKWCNESGLQLAHPNNAPAFMWVDLETTGLKPEMGMILEFGAVLTDKWGDIIGEPIGGFVRGAGYEDALFDAHQNPIVETMHTTSGLWAEYNQASADNTVFSNFGMQNEFEKLLDIFCLYLPPKTIRLAGSTAGFDKGFLQVDLPELIETRFSHRVIDVSSFKEVCRELNPELFAKLPEYWTPKKAHRSKLDIVDSIHEYKFYVENFLFIPGGDDV